MIEIKKGRIGLLGWIAAALVVVAIAAFTFCGCADKKITRTIIDQVLPVEHPSCPPHQCWKDDKCSKCEDGEN